MSSSSAPIFSVHKRYSAESSGNQSASTDFTLETPDLLAESPLLSRSIFGSFDSTFNLYDDPSEDPGEAAVADKKEKFVPLQFPFPEQKTHGWNLGTRKSRTISIDVPESAADDPIEQSHTVVAARPSGPGPSVYQGPRWPDAEQIESHLFSCPGCDDHSERGVWDAYPIPTPRTIICVPPPPDLRRPDLPGGIYWPPSPVDFDDPPFFLEERTTAVLEHHRRLRAALDDEWFSKPAVKVKTTRDKRARVRVRQRALKLARFAWCVMRGRGGWRMRRWGTGLADSGQKTRDQ